MSFMKIFDCFRKTFTIFKVNVNRSLSYLSIANSGMILFLALSKLQDYGFEFPLTYLMPIIFLGTLLILGLVGWIDDKLKLHHEENRLIASKNPYILELIERLKRIEEKIDNKK